MKNICGDCAVELPKLVKRVNANIVVLDPPRKGLDNKTIQNLLKIRANKIVYISCNPATMARDIKILSDMYEIKVVQPVDMFPYTRHVECVLVLCRK